MDDDLFLRLCLLKMSGLGLSKASILLKKPQEGFDFLEAHPNKDQIRVAAEQEFSQARKLNVQIISQINPNYPTAFTLLKDPPSVLYCAGDLSKTNNYFGIIGTRRATHYGKEMGALFGQELAAQGFVIVSGLAHGIDTSAHQGALKGGTTVAILGSGLANIYPKENQDLARTIAQKGAVISEFPLHTPPHAYNFPRRNRLVSALSQGLLLVEAPLKSGAMGTMELGRALGRKLFALPGRADIETFRGNHALIKQKVAELVEKPEEIVEAFGDKISSSSPCALPSCSPEEAQLLAVFPQEEVTLDWLTVQGGITAAALNTLLMRLLLKGLVKEYPNKRYRKKN